jgi:hypothetical protein
MFITQWCTDEGIFIAAKTRCFFMCIYISTWAQLDLNDATIPYIQQVNIQQSYLTIHAAVNRQQSSFSMNHAWSNQ